MTQAYKTVYKTRPGVSLLVALILIGLLVLFGLIVSGVVVASIRESANVNRANQAFYAAEGALEQGLMENWDKGAGYSNENPVPVQYAQPGAKGNYKIMGQVPKGADGGPPYGADGYGIPSPGSGDAGADCDSLNAFTKGTFYYSITEVPHYLSDTKYGMLSNDKKPLYVGPYEALNHPCNWGKLKVGESVVVPLYVTKDGQVLNPADPDFNLTTLKIKIRTPCPKEKGEYCSPIGLRMELDTENGDPAVACSADNPVRCGDAIVGWEITGSNIKGDKVYNLKAYDALDEKGWRKITDSEIYELKINNGKGGNSCIDCLLSEKDVGNDLINDIKEGKIFYFLWNQGKFLRAGDDKLNKPVLKLTIIHSLQVDKFSDIPYLEYQILANTNINTPPTDSSQTITAEGYSGTFKQVLEVKQPQESGILEYVIQQ